MLLLSATATLGKSSLLELKKDLAHSEKRRISAICYISREYSLILLGIKRALPYECYIYCLIKWDSWKKAVPSL